MKTKIITDKDLATLRTLALLDDSASLPRLIASAALAICPTKDDTFSCTIAKHYLAASYSHNPSLFAKFVLSHCIPSFQDASGHQSDDPRLVEIIIYRQKRFKKYTRIKLSVESHILQALLAQPPALPLTIPLTEMPPFFSTHPEQLTYRIKCQTNQRIKIKKTKTSWTISLK